VLFPARFAATSTEKRKFLNSAMILLCEYPVCFFVLTYGMRERPIRELPLLAQGVKYFLLTSPLSLSPKTLSSVNLRDVESKFGGSFSE
jgi:hypothetical protein